VLVGVTPPRMDLVVARLYELLDGVTRLLREDKDAISDLVRAGAKTLKSIDGLLSENQREVGKLVSGLERLTTESTELVRTLRAGIGQPERVRSILASLERTSLSVSRNIDGVISRTNRALDGVGAIAESIGPAEKQRIRRALDQLVKLGDQVYALTTEARSMVSQVSSGKGTAGALIAREELYQDLKEMVRDLKRNPWKFLWRE